MGWARAPWKGGGFSWEGEGTSKMQDHSMAEERQTLGSRPAAHPGHQDRPFRWGVVEGGAGELVRGQNWLWDLGLHEQWRLLEG